MSSYIFCQYNKAFLKSVNVKDVFVLTTCTNNCVNNLYMSFHEPMTQAVGGACCYTVCVIVLLSYNKRLSAQGRVAESQMKVDIYRKPKRWLVLFHFSNNLLKFTFVLTAYLKKLSFEFVRSLKMRNSCFIQGKSVQLGHYEF